MGLVFVSHSRAVKATHDLKVLLFRRPKRLRWAVDFVFTPYRSCLDWKEMSFESWAGLCHHAIEFQASRLNLNLRPESY